MEKLSINLLQAELLPEQAFWTLKRVVSIWVIVFLLMSAWMLLSQYQLKQLSDEFTVLNLQKKRQDNRLTELEKKISDNRTDPALEEELKVLKTLLAHKKVLLSQLTDSSTTYTAGFSTAMTELSQLHHRNISLQQVKMNTTDMTFIGLAKTPEAVPHWLAGFEQSTFLAGKSFLHFSLNENEQKMTEFAVSSRVLTPSQEE